MSDIVDKLRNLEIKEEIKNFIELIQTFYENYKQTNSQKLRFFGEILNGESKDSLSKKENIDNIQNILDNIKGSLTNTKIKSFTLLSFLVF